MATSTMLIFAAGQRSTVTTLISDTFTDANNTNLASHTPDIRPGSNAWSVVSTGSAGSPAIQIQSNMAQATAAAAGDGDTGIINSGNATITVSCAVVARTNMHAGIIARWQDSNNFWLLDIDAATNAFTLYERSSGTFTSRATTSFSFVDGTSYAVKLVCSGSSFTGTFNAGHTLTFTSSDFSTATITGIRQGFAAGGATAPTFDNFLVTTP
jgi:hypothetical protein